MQHKIGWVSMIKSLGTFGVLLLIMASLVLWSLLSFKQIVPILLEMRHQTIKLHILEKDVSYNLLETSLQTTYYALSKGDEKYLAAYQQAKNNIDQALANLTTTQGVQFSEAEEARLKSIEDAWMQRDLTLQALRSAAAAGDEAKIASLKKTFEAQSKQLHQAFDDLVFYVQMERDAIRDRMAARLERAITVSTIGLIALPLLALWAFGVAMQTPEPLLRLTHTITALQGSRLSGDLLADLKLYGEPIGPLARSIEQLAQTIQTRQAELETEISALREQLHNARQRRRRPISPRLDRGGADDHSL